MKFWVSPHRTYVMERTNPVSQQQDCEVHPEVSKALSALRDLAIRLLVSEANRKGFVAISGVDDALLFSSRRRQELENVGFQFAHVHNADVVIIRAKIL